MAFIYANVSNFNFKLKLFVLDWPRTQDWSDSGRVGSVFDAFAVAQQKEISAQTSHSRQLRSHRRKTGKPFLKSNQKIFPILKLSIQVQLSKIDFYFNKN